MAAAATPPKYDFNLDYFKTPAGQMRVVEAVLSLAALISSVEGYCENDLGRYGFFIFVVVITMLEAIFIVILFVLRIDKKLTFVNIPLSLLLNDCIALVIYFINCTLAMLSIGRCGVNFAARIIAMLFTISLFLVFVGLSYTDYKFWQNMDSSKDTSKDGGTTITESSPTVLT